jgi:HPt (histidine-containing phosphotransfer) domain-containing protein
MTDNNQSIDKAKLDELREILEDEGLQELIADFFELCNSDIQNLKQASLADVTEDIFRISHGLKSSSGNLGFVKMSELCRNLETQARTKELTDAELQTQSIIDEFNHLKELLT